MTRMGLEGLSDRLNGLTVALTGASRGIGRACARQLAAWGANLVLGSRNIGMLEQVQAELTRSYPDVQVVVLPLDVTDSASVDSFAEGAVQAFGSVDALVNSAGWGVFERALDLTEEQFDRMVAVNLKGTFLCCQAFGRRMLEQGHGHIINLVSIAGTTALAGCAGYSASKFGVLGLTKVLQTEWRRQGVQVTAVIPGSVDSSFWDGMESTPDRNDMIPEETIAAHIVNLLGAPPGAYVDEVTIMPPKGIL